MGRETEVGLVVSASRAVELVLALLALSFLTPAAADEVDANLTTLVQGMKDLRDGQVYSTVPLMELMSVDDRDIQNPWIGNFSLVLSGWGALQFGDTTPMPGAPGMPSGDLSQAYVQGTEFDKHLEFRLGRQDVTGGAAQVLPIDGARVTLSPWKNIGVTAYGGALVVPRFATADGDAAAGGRIFWRPTYETEGGVSFVEVLDRGLIARQELGVDARYVPWRWLTLTGYALVSTLEWRLAEGSLTATWQPLHNLQINADYRRTAPDLFISAASIFSVFAEEQQDELGGSAYYRLIKWLSFDGDFHAIDTDEGWGNRAQLRASFHFAPAATFGLQGKELLVQVAPTGAPAPFMPLTEGGANGYWALVGFGTYNFSPHFFATIDLEAYRFRASVNGEENSLYGTVTVNYDINQLWRFSIAGIQSQTPLLAQNTEVIARIAFNPTITFRDHH